MLQFRHLLANVFSYAGGNSSVVHTILSNCVPPKCYALCNPMLQHNPQQVASSLASYYVVFSYAGRNSSGASMQLLASMKQQSRQSCILCPYSYLTH